MSPTADKNEFKDKAYELVKSLKEKVRNLKEPEFVTGNISVQIKEIEDLLNSGHYQEFEEKYEEVVQRIETIEVSQKSIPLARKLLWIELFYLFFLLLLGYCTFKLPDFVLWNSFLRDPVLLHLQTVWFGALGGITIAIYGIFQHTQARDFDPKYELWYICKPIMGGVFGWFVYMIYFIGLVSVQGFDSVKIHTRELPYVIAFLAGFSERFTLKMIDKLMGVLTTWEEKKSDSILKKVNKKKIS